MKQTLKFLRDFRVNMSLEEFCVLILVGGATLYIIGYNVGLPKAVTQEQ